MESLVLASCSASPRLLLSAARGRRPSSQLLPAPWPVAAAAGRREARRPKLVVAVAAQGSKNGEGAACPVASVIARKRKTDAAPRLDEADRTLYSTFCGAANSLSQLYTQAMAQQKLSFQAGERHALAGSGAGTMLSAVHGFNTDFLSSRSM